MIRIPTTRLDAASRVGEHVVQLSELSGREFFDAVVPLGAIQAVVIKARSK